MRVIIYNIRIIRYTCRAQSTVKQLKYIKTNFFKKNYLFVRTIKSIPIYTPPCIAIISMAKPTRIFVPK